MIWFMMMLAWADCPEVEARVVGYTDDGSVVVRSVREGTLSLATYDPGKTQPSKTWTIQEPGESQQVRGENWKAAETELTGLGYTIVPDFSPVDLTTLGGDGVRYTKMSHGRDGDHWSYLVRTSNGSSTVLDPHMGGCCVDGQTRHTRYDGPYRPPETSWLVFVQHLCVEPSVEASPVIWFEVK